MSNALEQFASALEKNLSAADGWRRSTVDLIPEAGNVPLFTADGRGAVLLVPGDGITPTMFRSYMDGLLKKAKAPASPRQPVNPIPWNALFVLVVFEDDFPSDLRAFIGNDRRPITPQRFIQGGWVSLTSAEANFRINKNQVENDLLQAVQQAVADFESAAAAPPPAATRGGRATEPVRRDLTGGDKPKKKGGGLVLFLGLLLILGAAGAYVYMTYFMEQPTETPAPVPAKSGAPAKKGTGQGKGPASGKSGGPEAASSAAPSAAPAAASSAAPAAASSAAPAAASSAAPSGAPAH